MSSNALTDRFGRRIEYLRISVIDRCDLRCSYCLPKGFKGFSEQGNWLTFEEIERVTRAFALLGVHRIRLTGGEPLMRRGLTDLVDRLAQLPGITDLSLSSNCTRMDKLAAPLYKAGVRRLNVSLDSLRPKVFKEITGGSLAKVLSGLDACQSAGFEPIRVNTVVMQGVNDDEIDTILDYCIERGFTLRLIETMPMGETGRNALDKYIALDTVKQRLERRIELIPDILPGGGPARYYRLADTDTRIGFITPMSQHFCETCNRVRLTVDGDLYLCLGHEHVYPLRQLLRDGIDDTGLNDHLRRAINLKPERHEFNERPEKLVRFMAKSGG
ncbi:MAG: GTP 3',8-cyclase MoaA [Candidatus Thiodiazotropha sp. DIVDIV]